MKEAPQVLYIEDDADDRELLQETLHRRAPELQLHFARNGLEALSSLSRLRDEQAPYPHLIVLDVNMPFLDGMQTLEVLQKDNDLKAIPVVVLSSSESPFDRAWFRERGIDYIIKPDNMQHLDRIASELLSRL